jgi:hypothetical protein
MLEQNLMPGQRGSENRRLSQAVTLRMAEGLAQRCAEMAAGRGLSLAGWLRSIAADAVATAQAPGEMEGASGWGVLGDSKDGLAQRGMALEIRGSLSSRRRHHRTVPRTVLRKPEQHIADLVRIGDGLADLHALLANIRQDQAILDERSNDQLPKLAAILLIRELSAFITARIEGGRDDQ